MLDHIGLPGTALRSDLDRLYVEQLVQLVRESSLAAVVILACEQVYDDVIRMLSLSGTRWDPTLAVDGADNLLLRDEPERLSDPKFRAVTREQAIAETLTGGYDKNVDDVALRGSVTLPFPEMTTA